MTKKKVTSEESKGSGGISPPKQSKLRLIKKSREKSPSFQMGSDVADNEPERSPYFASSLPYDVRARIRTRAYQLYERRGGYPGQDLEDWLEAERQILSERI